MTWPEAFFYVGIFWGIVWIIGDIAEISFELLRKYINWRITKNE